MEAILDLEGEESGKGLVPAIDRAVRILALLENTPQVRLTVTEIARRLGIPKSTTFNLCTALVDGQLLRRSHEGFQLGRRLVSLGSAYVSSVDLVREFYEVCRAAPVDLGATIQLSVLDDGFNAIYLAYQDCNSGLQLGLSGAVGRLVPANCSASGKALLAALPAAEFEARLQQLGRLSGLTPTSIVSIAKLRKELAHIRQQGFATETGEAVSGLTCVAGVIRAAWRDEELIAISITANAASVAKGGHEAIRATLAQLIQLLQSRL